MQSSKVKIKIKDVVVLYGSVRALDGVKLEINDGEFTGIIGPNGAGKTTLLRCLYKAIKPTYGAIYIDNRNIEDYKQKEIVRIIATAPTEIPSEFNLSVSDIILMGRYPYANSISWWESKEDILKASEIIAKLDLENILSREFSTLSSGQKRRVLIAKALVQEPKVLLADEPTANLDLRYQLEVAEILREISRSGVTVLATFHDLNIAARVCDKLVLLKDGKVFSVGEPHRVLTPESIKEVYGVEADVVKFSREIFIIPKRPLR